MYVPFIGGMEFNPILRLLGKAVGANGFEVLI